MEIWTVVTNALWTDSLTDSQTLKDSATQLLIKYKSGALVPQFKKRDVLQTSKKRRPYRLDGDDFLEPML